MKTLRFPILSIFIFSLQISTSLSAQDCYWSSHIGGTSDESAVVMGTDRSGNVYISCGTASESCFLNTDTLIHYGDNLSYFVKYDAEGNEVWIKSFYRPGGVFGTGGGISGIIDTIHNEIIAYGNFWGMLQLPDTTLEGPAQTIVLMKMDLDGNVIWARCAGGQGDDYAFGRAYDEQGNIYLTGVCSDSAKFEGTTIPHGGFMAKYDENGNLIWAKNKFRYSNQFPWFPYPYTDSPPFSLVYSKNKLLVNGDFYNDTIVIDTITIVKYLGYMCSYVASFDTGGNIQWIRDAGGPEGVCGTQFTTDTSGDIFITGYFITKGIFGTDTLRVVTPGASDCFIVEYSSTGEQKWVKQLNPSISAGGRAVTTDKIGGVYLAGKFRGTAYFGNDTLTSQLPVNAFIAHLTSTGDFTGTRTYPPVYIYSFCTDNSGNLFLTGNFQDTVSLGPNTFISYGGTDIFSAKCLAITGIEEKSMPIQDQLLIYANPTTGKCNIKIPEDFRHEKSLTLQIFDNQGRMIQSIPVIMDQEKISFNIAAQAKGMYNAILSNGKKRYSGKILFE